MRSVQALAACASHQAIHLSRPSTVTWWSWVLSRCRSGTSSRARAPTHQFRAGQQAGRDVPLRPTWQYSGGCGAAAAFSRQRVLEYGADPLVSEREELVADLHSEGPRGLGT